MPIPTRPTTCARLRGWTLIELLGVVALLGVMLAIAIPSYQSYLDKARLRQALIDMASMSATIQSYQVDNRDFPPTLAAVKLTGRLDPWGRAYVYYNVDANGRGGARKDRALNPLNTDFDLYSLGPDGVTQSQITQRDSLDDLIRANNGGYFGVAGDF
jgi:general secretion pathway protein G